MNPKDPVRPEPIIDDAEENLLVKYKWVRIMCDYSADGLWDRDGSANTVDELPVSEDLKQRIRTWQESYDAIDDDPWKQPPVTDWSEFAKVGLEIAKSVKLNLPDWSIFYFDEQKYFEKPFEDYIPTKRSRKYYEYEIIIDVEGNAVSGGSTTPYN
jgi:hypothetical protein